MKNNALFLVLLAPLLITLPGCWSTVEQKVKEIKDTVVGGKKEQTTSSANPANAVQAEAGTGPWLLTVRGKTAVTESQFNDYLDEVLKAQPQYKQVMAFMEDGEQQFFDSMANEVGIKHWISENKIDQRADFQRDLKLGHDFLERQLAIKYFQEEYPKKNKFDVTDADAQKIYEERKALTPELIIARGGVTANAVMFDNEPAAQAFLAKAVEPGTNFEQAAREQSLKVQAFKQVNDQSFEVDGPLREKFLSYKTFPITEIVKSKDKFWVVQATAKEEVQYVPFQEVKDVIKQQLKMQKLFTEELDKVKKDLNMVVNQEYFEKKKKEKKDLLDKMQKEQEAAIKKQTNNAPKPTPKPAQAPKPAASATKAT